MQPGAARTEVAVLFGGKNQLRLRARGVAREGDTARVAFLGPGAGAAAWPVAGWGGGGGGRR